MASSSPPFVISDRYIWITAGLFAAYAAYATQSQLKTFKARCVSKPPAPLSSSDAAVNRATEDGSSSSSTSQRDSRMTERILTMSCTAIKLETLGALARGINFDLRNAALKIITERAITPTNIEFLVRQIEGRNPTARLRALKAMCCLIMTGSSSSFISLCTRDVFRALVTCLKNTLPPNADPAAQKEATYLMSQLMSSYFMARDMAVEAGIVDWLKVLEVPGYRNVVEAIRDLDRYDANDTSLLVIVNTVMDETTNGRRLMIEAGLLRSSGNEDERGVEVEIEVEVVDLATAHRPQGAWGRVGGLGGLLGNSLPTESHWTEG